MGKGCIPGLTCSIRIQELGTSGLSLDELAVSLVPVRPRMLGRNGLEALAAASMLQAATGRNGSHSEK
jgi:hypothetical protein